MITIWHNPRCSKSRQTLALIEASGQSFAIRKYLENPPTEPELRAAFTALPIEDVAQMMRTGDPAFKDSSLSVHSADGDLFALMAAHPVVIERPIVFKDTRAFIGRPPEAVKTLL